MVARRRMIYRDYDDFLSPIQAGLVDGFRHAGGDEVVNRPAGLEAGLAIWEEETPSGKPARVRPRKGGGNCAGPPPGRGTTTISASAASSAVSRQVFSLAALSAPMR